MTFRLVTGRGEHDHVTSDDYGTLYSKTIGDGRYKLDDFTCSVIDANTIHISEGNLLIDGRHFRNSSEGTNLIIANGEQLKNRIDLVVCRYDFESFGEDYLEHGVLAVIQGVAVDGQPQVPAYTAGSILNGDKFVEVPLFTIPITGIAVGTPSACMLPSYKLHTKYGGTGDLVLPLALMPVGYVYTSFDSTSPASLFGGTWEQLKNVFLRAGEDTAVGGSDSMTLSTSNMPSHSHIFSGTSASHNHTFTGTAAEHNHGFTGTAASHGHTFTGTAAQHRHLANGGDTSNVPKAKFVILQNLTVVPDLRESLAWSSTASVSGGSYAPYTTANYDWGTAQYTANTSVTPAGTISNQSITPSGTVANKSITPAGSIESKSITPSGTISSAGSGTAFDNRPKYQNVYAWKRVA